MAERWKEGRYSQEYGGDQGRAGSEASRGYGQGGQGEYGRQTGAYGGEGSRSYGQQGEYGQGQYGQEGSWREGGYGRQSGMGGSGDEPYRGFGQERGYGSSDREWRGSDWQSGRWGGSGREFGGSRGSGSGQDYGQSAGRSGYSGRGGYGTERQFGERSWWDRAGDEVRSWMGDEEAERRRSMDMHRGRGPKDYNRSDDRIREDICDRLTDDPMVDASEIQVQVSSGEITLSGTVEDRFTKRRAEDCAESVSGVKHVQNNLRVEHGRGQTSMASGTSASTGTGTGTSATTGAGTAGASAAGKTAGTTRPSAQGTA